MGFSRQEYWSGLLFPSPGELPDPGIEPTSVSCFGESSVDSLPTAAATKSLQSCPSLCDPIDGSPPGSAIPGILQARTLEWVAISLSCIGEGNGTPLQCSCLENPRDRRAWWAAVYGVTQSWTLSNGKKSAYYFGRIEYN